MSFSGGGGEQVTGSPERRSGVARYSVVIVLLTAAVVGSLLLARGAEAALGCDSGGPATKRWDGGGGTTSWSTAKNWTGDTLPTSSDHVCIPATAPGARVVVNTTLTVQSIDSRKPFWLDTGTLTLFNSTQPSNFGAGYRQKDGTLTGAGPRTLAGPLAWTGGMIGGTGVTTVPSGATLVTSGAPMKWFAGPFTNRGTIRLTGTGDVQMFTGAVLTNHNLIDLRGDTNLTWNSSSTAKVTNTATGKITKTSGTATELGVPLENDGAVRSDVGDLQLTGGQAGSTTSVGSFGAAANATTTLASSQTFAPGAKLTGPGAVVLESGTASGPLSIPTATTLRWVGGTLAGPASGSNLVIAKGGTLKVDGPDFKTLEGRVVNGGLIDVVGEMRAGSTASVVNKAVLRLADESSISIGSGSPLLTNAKTGTVQKVGTSDGLAVSDMPLDNDGKVSVVAGTLEWGAGSGAGTSLGQYVPAAGTTLLLNSGTHVVGAGAGFGGPGSVVLDGATVSGPFSLVGGTTTFRTGNLQGPASTDTASAAVAPTGRLIVENQSYKTVKGHIVNNGLVGIRGAVRADPATRLVNAKTMTLFDGSAITHGSGEVQLENLATGQLLKTGTAGSTATIGIPVENDGVVRADKGILELDNGSGTGRTSTGSYGALSGQQLLLSGGTHAFGPGGRITPGTTTVTGGTVTGPLAVKSGATLAQVAGDLVGPKDGSAPMTVELGGTLRTATTTFKQLSGAVLNKGTVRLDGNLRMSDLAQITNQATIDVVDSAHITLSGTAPQFIRNTATGTLRKVGTGASAATIDAPVDNDGVVTAASGRLSLAEGTGAAGQSTGSYGAATAGTLAFAGGTHALASTARIVGPGRVDVEGGTLSGPFVVKAGARLFQTTGDVSGPTQAAGGAALVEAGATWTVATDAFKSLSGVVRNQGRLLVQGRLRMPEGTLLRNAALLEMQGAPWIDASGSQSIVNEATGRVTKTGVQSSEATIDVPLENDGLVQAHSGTLHLSGGTPSGVSDGEYGSLAIGGLVRFDSGVHRLSATARLTGPGRTELGYATLQGPFTIATGASFLQTAGALNAPSDGTGQVTVQSGAVYEAAGSSFKQLRGRLRNDGTVLVRSTLRMDPGATLRNASLLTLQEEGWLQSSSSPQQVLNLPSGLVAATDGLTGVDVDFDNQGEVRVDPTASLSLDRPLDFTGGVLREGAWHLKGKLVLTTSSSTKMTGNATDLVLEGPDVAIQAAGENDALTAFASNTGTLTVRGRELSVSAPTFTNDGTLALDGDGHLSVGTFVQRAGETTVGEGSRISAPSGVQLNGGALSGAGTIEGDLRNNGTSPPVELRSGGELDVTGAYVQGAAGVVSAQLGAGTGPAQRMLLGEAPSTVGGTLRVRTGPGFIPVAGESYELGTFVARTGTFATTDLQAPAGFRFVPYYTPTAFGVRVQAAS